MKAKTVNDKVVKKKIQVEKTPLVLNTRERFLKNLTAVLRSPYTLLVLVILCLVLAILCLFSMYRLNEKLNVQVTEETEQTEQNNEYLEMMEKRLIEWGEEAEQNVLAVLSGSSDESLRAIRSLDINIMALLDAQRRRTLESFYKEDVLTAERREAAVAFAAGRYVTANILYREIAAAHPEDQEARFYQYYALFLINKMDRDNYRLIWNAMTLLERQGYTRKELTETLEFIANETETDGEPSP